MIKWTTELKEYDLQYQSRITIKAQALAGLLLETSEDEDKGFWKVFVDNSATRKGSGVGVLLVSPQGDEIKITIQLCFKASNKEAEYEALLASIHTTKYVRAIKVILHSDSQLVAQ